VNGPGAALKDILIVDDSLTVTTLLQVYLSGWPVRCHVASSGEKALSLLGDLRPDLVITDVVMPGMDGFALVAALRGSPTHSKVPIVMLTNEKDEDARERGRAAGVSAFLTKPISVSELRAVLARILGIGMVGT